jgi:hypothetical protein
MPALLLTFYEALENRRDATAAAKANALTVAEDASRTQELLIYEAHQLLLGLARLPEARDADAESCPALLAGIARRCDAYATWA